MFHFVMFVIFFIIRNNMNFFYKFGIKREKYGNRLLSSFSVMSSTCYCLVSLFQICFQLEAAKSFPVLRRIYEILIK